MYKQLRKTLAETYKYADLIGVLPFELTRDQVSRIVKENTSLTTSDVVEATDSILSRLKMLKESAAPGQEDWIKSNKSRFAKQYGKKKGDEVLYATAWKRSKQTENVSGACATGAAPTKLEENDDDSMTYFCDGIACDKDQADEIRVKKEINGTLYSVNYKKKNGQWKYFQKVKLVNESGDFRAATPDDYAKYETKLRAIANNKVHPNNISAFVRDAMESIRNNPKNLWNDILRSLIQHYKTQKVNEAAIRTIKRLALSRLTESENPMYDAIANRIIRRHPAIIAKYGLDRLLSAIEDVSSSYSEFDEIGTSDVSVAVKQVIDQLDIQG